MKLATLLLVTTGARAGACTWEAPPANRRANGMPKIKHLVVLMMENRALDHVFGCMAGEGVIALDGIAGNNTHSLPRHADGRPVQASTT